MAQKNQGMSEDTKSLITVLLLIFIYPIGLILMFFWVKWPLWVKLLIGFPLTIFFVVIFFAIIGVIINPSAQIEKAQEVSETTTSYPEETRQEFIANCVSGGAPESACTCIINYVEEELPWEQYGSLMENPTAEFDKQFTSVLQKAATDICHE